VYLRHLQSKICDKQMDTLGGISVKGLERKSKNNIFKDAQACDFQSRVFFIPTKLVHASDSA
jgi:hypothetical protein